MQIVNSEAQKTGSTSQSDFTQPEQLIIQEFFASLRGLYTAAQINAAWPTNTDKRLAMRMWGQEIIDLGGIGRCDALQHCKRMMGEDPDNWRHINMGQIAKKPPPVKAAHRLWTDNLPISDSRSTSPEAVAARNAPQIESKAPEIYGKKTTIASLRALLDGD